MFRGRSGLRLLIAAAVILVLAVGCGDGGEEGGGGGGPGTRVSGGGVTFVTSTPGPRPTLRPTFTVAPTSTPTRVPTATVPPTVGPTRVARPTVTPRPTVAGEDGGQAEPEATEVAVVTEGVAPADTVTVGGVELEVPGTRIELGGDNGYLEVALEAVFPYQYEEPPRFLLKGDVAWPVGEHFISRGTRFVYWAIEVDAGNARGSWSMPVFFRWVDDALFASDQTIMLEAPGLLQDGSTTIYQGVGRATPGFWREGQYTVYLLDRNFEELMRQSFRVR